MLVRPLCDDDRSCKVEALDRAWGSSTVARQGTLVDAAGLPGFVAIVDGHRVGLLTYARDDEELEVVTLQVEREGGGTGRALMDEVLRHARLTDVRRLWLVTTNDNIRAIRFYQQWGMDLAAFIADGVAVSRRVKPTIPMIGTDGIAVRHELFFEFRLRDAWAGAAPEITAP